MMNQVLKCELFGASIARMEGGQVYASLYIGQPVTNEKEENAKGIVIMKLSCDEQVYEDLKSSNYPCPADLHVRLKKAAGGKLGQHCFKLELPQSHPRPTAKAS